jgi:hypothetical protein
LDALEVGCGRLLYGAKFGMTRDLGLPHRNDGLEILARCANLLVGIAFGETSSGCAGCKSREEVPFLRNALFDCPRFRQQCFGISAAFGGQHLELG